MQVKITCIGRGKRCVVEDLKVIFGLYFIFCFCDGICFSFFIYNCGLIYFLELLGLLEESLYVGGMKFMEVGDVVVVVIVFVMQVKGKLTLSLFNQGIELKCEYLEMNINYIRYDSLYF